MKHLFTTGEEIHKKNLKQLLEGMLVVNHICYDDITDNTIFEASGTLDELPVSVNFKIKDNSFRDIKYRFDVKILAQSDLLRADWESYKIVPSN